MPIKIGELEALFRYPVKSMSGENLDATDLGWHGLVGDRRLAFRRIEDQGGFPWLTASRLPELILFRPLREGPAALDDLPTHIRTPEGEVHALFDKGLAADVGRRCGLPVEVMHLNRGIFDEASVSMITSATVEEIGQLSAQAPDARRFRPNILIRTLCPLPFEEDEWVGGLLSFGEGNEATTIAVVNRDERCSVIGFDPDSAQASPQVLKAVVRMRNNKAGVYGTVVRRGRLAVGQSIFFEPAAAGRLPERQARE